MLDIFGAQAATQHVELVLDSEMPVPDMRVNIDKMRCQQVVINLISNAIKFSKPLDRIVVKICKPELIQ